MNYLICEDSSSYTHKWSDNSAEAINFIVFTPEELKMINQSSNDQENPIISVVCTVHSATTNQGSMKKLIQFVSNVAAAELKGQLVSMLKVQDLPSAFKNFYKELDLKLCDHLLQSNDPSAMSQAFMLSTIVIIDSLLNGRTAYCATLGTTDVTLVGPNRFLKLNNDSHALTNSYEKIVKARFNIEDDVVENLITNINAIGSPHLKKVLFNSRPQISMVHIDDTITDVLITTEGFKNLIDSSCLSKIVEKSFETLERENTDNQLLVCAICVEEARLRDPSPTKLGVSLISLLN